MAQQHASTAGPRRAGDGARLGGWSSVRSDGTAMAATVRPGDQPGQRPTLPPGRAPLQRFNPLIRLSIVATIKQEAQRSRAALPGSGAALRTPLSRFHQLDACSSEHPARSSLKMPRRGVCRALLTPREGAFASAGAAACRAQSPSPSTRSACRLPVRVSRTFGRSLPSTRARAAVGAIPSSSHRRMRRSWSVTRGASTQIA